MWEELARFYKLCEEQAVVPSAWLQIRQVHLGKGKPKDSDGTMLTTNLRPISVSSMMWRVYNKARFRHVETQRWLKRAMPPSLYGGVPGRGTQDALGPLLAVINKGWYVGTLDLEKAFDRADPQLAARIMRHCGMDPGVANFLNHVWGQKTRWLQLLGQTLPEPQHVSSPLPQGESWSMTAMSFLLIPPILDISSRVSHTEHVIYADDRSFACRKAAGLATVTRM